MGIYERPAVEFPDAIAADPSCGNGLAKLYVERHVATGVAHTRQNEAPRL